MSKKSKAVIDADNQTQLLKYLLAVELWKAGLSQSEIKSRLGMDSNLISGMLKGLVRKGDQL